MAADGVLCIVGMPMCNLDVPIFDMTYRQKTVVGSNSGTR